MTLQVAIVTVTPFQQNCSILWDDEGGPATVVDPGGDVPRILAALDRAKRTVGQILLTHGHVDHAGGVVALKDALAARDGTAPPVVGPDKRDDFLLASLPEHGRAFGIEGVRAFTPDRWLSEGETVSIGGRDFAILHCPGHSPGSLVYVSKPLGFAIVGDVLFQGSVGRTDFPYGDTEELLTAIHDKLLPLGDEIAFICGHGPGSTFGEERHGNPFLQAGPI